MCKLPQFFPSPSPYIVSFSDRGNSAKRNVSRDESCWRGEAEVCTGRTVTPPSITGADRRHASRIFHCSVKSEARCATRRAVLSRALVPTVSLYTRLDRNQSSNFEPVQPGGWEEGRCFVCSCKGEKSCDWSWLLFEKFFVLIFGDLFFFFVCFCFNSI